MKRVHDLLGLPPEYHEDGPPEYTTPPDEYNRFAPAAPESKGRSKLMKMLLLVAAGLSLLGFSLPGLSIVPEAEPTPTPAAIASPTPAPAVALVPIESASLATAHAAPTSTPEPTPTSTPEPTPEPTPGVTITYYRRSEVYEAFAYWAMPEQMESVTVRLTDPYMGTIFEHLLDAEEVARGYYELNHFDLYNYLYTNDFSFDNLPSGYDPSPLLEVTYAYGENGPTGTETAEAAYEMWVNLSYDDPDDDMSWIWGSYYPGCFVARIEDRLNYDGLKIYYGEQDELSPGDVWVRVTVDGRDIPAETCRLVLEPHEEANGEVYYSYTFVMPRPDTFPEHGTAHLTITQKLVHYDMTATRERDYDY